MAPEQRSALRSSGISAVPSTAQSGWHGALDSDNQREGFDNPGLKKFQKTFHNRGYVSRIAMGQPPPDCRLISICWRSQMKTIFVPGCGLDFWS